MPHDNHTSEINPALSKNDINQIVSSESMQQAIKDTHDAWEKTKFKWQIFVALIMAFSAAFGYYLKWDSDRKDRIEQQIQFANERKAEEIQAVINQKMEWMIKVDKAVMNMRKTRELIIIGCKYNLPRNRYYEETIRFKARYNVANAFDGIRFIFNNNLENKFLDLTKFDESINNVCSKSAPSDHIWHQYVIDLNNLMAQSIKNDKNSLETLQR